MDFYTFLYHERMKSLGMSSTWVAWTFSAFEFAWSVAPCVAGPLAQRLGWKSVSFFSGIICAFSTLALSFVTSPLVFSVNYALVLGKLLEIL